MDRTAEFLVALADVLEVPAVTEATDYRTVPLWGSLTCFALKVMLQQRFERTLTLQEIADCPTAGALMAKVLA